MVLAISILSDFLDHVKSGEIEEGCATEVRRVMRERAVAVDLVPDIEQACLNDLVHFCSAKAITKGFS